jgi:hypothetical protein
VTNAQPAPFVIVSDSAALASAAGTLYTKRTKRCGELAGVPDAGR